MARYCAIARLSTIRSMRPPIAVTKPLWHCAAGSSLPNQPAPAAIAELQVLDGKINLLAHRLTEAVTVAGSRLLDGYGRADGGRLTEWQTMRHALTLLELPPPCREGWYGPAAAGHGSMITGWPVAVRHSAVKVAQPGVGTAAAGE